MIINNMITFTEPKTITDILMSKTRKLTKNNF